MGSEYELYFYFDGDHEEEGGCIAPMCCKCHDESWGYLGWYYKGVLGPWRYTCEKCGSVIKDGTDPATEFETIEA